MKYKHSLLLFILILLLGIALRLYTFTQISSTDKFTWIGGDEATYYELASNIHEGRGPVIDYVFQFWNRHDFGENEGLWEPFFPFTLAYFFYIFGHSLLAAKIVVLLISIATLVLIYFIGKAVYNEISGLIAMFLLAIQPKHIEYSATLFKDNLYAFLFLLAFFLMILAFKKNKLYLWILLGIALALTFLTRYFAAVLILTFVVLLIIYRKRVNWKFVGFETLVFIVVLLPWAIYTYNTHGMPFFSITRHYPYSASGWEGMSYQAEAPTLKGYLEENSAADIIKTRLTLFPLTIYNLPIWMTPLVFLLFILVFALKDSYARAIKWYFFLLLAFYLIQFANVGQFNERAFLTLIYASLVPIGYIISKVPEMSRKFKLKVDRKIILSVLLVLILISSLTLLQWKLNDIKSYKMQERQEALARLGAWVKANTTDTAVIMTILPPDVHYYTDRRTVMDPYNFAASLGIYLDPPENRNKNETIKYGVTHFLIHTSNKTAIEGYLALSYRPVYADEEAELYLYKIR